MKNIILLLLLSPMALFANHAHNGKLKIQSDHRQPILVEIDGHAINWFPAKSVTARNLAPGYHQVQISETIWSMGAQRQRILFRGEVMIEPNHTTLARMDRDGRLYINGQAGNHHNPPQHHNNPDPRQVCGVCHQQYVGQHQCGQTYHSPYQGHAPNTGYGYGYGNNYNTYQGGYGSYNNYGGTNQYGAMSNRAFNDLIDLIEGASFESTKVSIARQGVGNNWITARQLREILERFSFESTRKDFARWGYDYLVDKENIHVIYRAFDFESSVQSLSAYFK